MAIKVQPAGSHPNFPRHQVCGGVDVFFSTHSRGRDWLPRSEPNPSMIKNYIKIYLIFFSIKFKTLIPLFPQNHPSALNLSLSLSLSLIVDPSPSPLSLHISTLGHTITHPPPLHRDFSFLYLSFFFF
jgi:hypothetical protein